MTNTWQEQLHAGEVVLMDGATGTELQRRGVPMNEIVWSGAAVLSHPDEVRATHEDYIRAGARVIITNTFGSTRQMLGPAGFGDQVETVYRGAVQLAQEARSNVGIDGVGIAGSISTEPPAFERDAFLAPAEELAAYREAATLLAESGVDLIALEMMVETVHSARAMRAAKETELPVWLGVSCRAGEDGALVSFDHAAVRFVDVLDTLLPMGPDVVNIMHTPIDAVPEAIQLVQERWAGPIGVYPESGYFTKPHWNFVDIISPENLVAEADTWVQAGARLLGGCCGTGPEHITALRKRFSNCN